MEKYKGKYRIESNRLRFWDYSQPASYFITICTKNRENKLGHISDGKMILSEYGKIVESEINKIVEYHKRIILDDWIIMPNHIHLIITLGNYDFDNGTGGNNGVSRNNGTTVEKIHEFSLHTDTDTDTDTNPETDMITNINTTATINNIKQYRKQRRKMIIPMILGKFQQQTSKHINILKNTPGEKNWQKDYHDHIICNNQSYEKIKNYIINNPKKWAEDTLNDGIANKI